MYLAGNIYECDFIILSSSSRVTSCIHLSQSTFIVLIFFPRSFLTWIFITRTGLTSKEKSLLIWTSSSSSTCVGLRTYFLSYDTWNTLYKFANYGGNTISYANGPIPLRILYGSINFGFNFFDMMALPTLVVEVNRRNTWSPISNSCDLFFLVSQRLLSTLSCSHPLLNDLNFLHNLLQQIRFYSNHFSILIPTQWCSRMMCKYLFDLCIN